MLTYPATPVPSWTYQTNQAFKTLVSDFDSGIKSGESSFDSRKGLTTSIIKIKYCRKGTYFMVFTATSGAWVIPSGLLIGKAGIGTMNSSPGCSVSANRCGGR